MARPRYPLAPAVLAKAFAFWRSGQRRRAFGQRHKPIGLWRRSDGSCRPSYRDVLRWLEAHRLVRHRERIDPRVLRRALLRLEGAQR